MNAITKITDSATNDKTTPTTIPETQRMGYYKYTNTYFNKHLVKVDYLHM